MGLSRPLFYTVALSLVAAATPLKATDCTYYFMEIETFRYNEKTASAEVSLESYFMYKVCDSSGGGEAGWGDRGPNGGGGGGQDIVIDNPWTSDEKYQYEFTDTFAHWKSKIWAWQNLGPNITVERSLELALTTSIDMSISSELIKAGVKLETSLKVGAKSPLKTPNKRGYYGFETWATTKKEHYTYWRKSTLHGWVQVGSNYTAEKPDGYVDKYWFNSAVVPYWDPE